MKSLKRIRQRAKRCYELAWKAVIEEPVEARLRLVHGWCWNDGFYYGHAWVLLPSGRVYDAVEDKYFSMHDYAVQYRAIVGRMYSRRQAAKASIRHKHSGPWWTDDEMRMHIAAGLPTGWLQKRKRKTPRRLEA